MSDIAPFPEPSAEALAHSARLREHIEAEILRAGGFLDFARYMELALYAPGLGYYSAGATKLGREGDFITAPEISPLFSRALARVCAEVLALMERPCIMEVGTGSGIMAADMLLQLQEMDRLPHRYLILEISAELRERQRHTLAHRAPGLASRVQWLDAPPEQSFDGIIIGNEVLDALPFMRFRRTAAGFDSLGVARTQRGLNWSGVPADAALADALRALESTLDAPLPAGYESEYCAMLPGWLETVLQPLRHGLVLFVDYGVGRRAYYHPERGRGTFLCHYRHRAHEDPFLWPGLQDITAWVDFTRVAETVTGMGMDLAGYTTQANLLLGAGIAQLLDPAEQDTRELAQASAAIQRLTLPGEMGEHFKAIAFTRGLDMVPAAFTLRDLSHTL